MNGQRAVGRTPFVAIVITAAIAIAALMIVLAGPASADEQGGPVVLAGIDAEDGGPGGHGPITTYEDLTNKIIAQVTTPGSGILVSGGNKNPSDDVTRFWDAVDAGVPTDNVTYVNGASDISNVDFTPFKMIVVVSDEVNTPSGGLTQAEDQALDARVSDVVAFVNSGGGLLGFSSAGLTNAYGYAGGLGAITADKVPDSDNITPTADGLAAGVNDTLDVCCWHDVFTSFPDFLKVLATHNGGGPGTDLPAAIGGSQVILTPTPAKLTLVPKADVNEVDEQHCVTATVEFDDGSAAPDQSVQFKVTGVSDASGQATTDSNGQAEFCYNGPPFPGDDVIKAFADSDNNGVQDAGEPEDQATKRFDAPSTEGCKVTNGGQITTDDGDKATFGANAQVSGSPKGNQTYQDHS